MAPRILNAYTPTLPPHVVISWQAPLRPPPQIPFFLDPAHTSPTKWSLYRPLLRFTRFTGDEGVTALPAVRRKIRELWRQNAVSTSIAHSRIFLEKQYELLAHLQSQTVDVRAEIRKLESHLAAAQAQADKRRALAEAIKPPRSRLQGSYIRPGLSNLPIPRLRPQPVEISMMIKKRVLAHRRRVNRYREARDLRADMREEVNFVKRTGAVGVGEWSGNWEAEMTGMMKGFEESFERDRKRGEGKFDQVTVERVERARKRRIGWAQERAKLRIEKVRRVKGAKEVEAGGAESTTEMDVG